MQKKILCIKKLTGLYNVDVIYISLLIFFQIATNDAIIPNNSVINLL